MPDNLNKQTTVPQVTKIFVTDTTLKGLFGPLLQNVQKIVLQITGY